MAGNDAGDKAHRHGDTVKLTYSGTGTEGDLVKDNGSGKVTATTANGDPILGVIAEDTSDLADGDDVAVHMHGAVYVNADGSITAHELLQPSGSTNGHAVSSDSSEDIVTAVDEGGTATYDIYSRTLVALEDGSDGNLVKAHLS